MSGVEVLIVNNRYSRKVMVRFHPTPFFNKERYMIVMATEMAWCLFFSVTAVSVVYGIGRAIEWFACEVFEE